jgi:hypothetical protein
MQESSVAETITIINCNSGFSDNQMAYRLALMMEKYLLSQSIHSTPALDPTQRENIIGEVRNTLSLTQNAQSTEEYRRYRSSKNITKSTPRNLVWVRLNKYLIWTTQQELKI